MSELSFHSHGTQTMTEATVHEHDDQPPHLHDGPGRIAAALPQGPRRGVSVTDPTDNMRPEVATLLRVTEAIRNGNVSYGLNGAHRTAADVLALLPTPARAAENLGSAHPSPHPQGGTDDDARAAIEALIDPEAGMGVSAYGDGRRFFDEADIRRALLAAAPAPTE